MAFLIREHYKKDLRKIFGLTEDSLDDIAGEIDNIENDAPTDQAPIEDSPAPDPSTDDSTAPAAEDPTSDPIDPNKEDAPMEDPAAGAEPKPPESEQVPGTGDMVQVESQDDDGKVSTMFRDIGKPETDYGLTNPNNIRLAKFRFKKAGIDINQMMNEVEQKMGISVEKILYRLTPEQYESYKEKGKEIRTKFDLIEKREKNIIMFNSRVPIYYLDKNTNKVQKVDETNPNLLKNAYTKIDEFLTKRFGDGWIDDLNAIDFLQGIKVNFAEKESITPNMITTKFFEGDEEKLIPFNKLYVKTPKAVEDFVKENKENQNYLRSAVYRTLAAGYLDGSTDSNGVYAILLGDAPEEQAETPKADAEVPSEASPEPGADNPAAESEADSAIADMGLNDESEPKTEPEPAPEAV